MKLHCRAAIFSSPPAREGGRECREASELAWGLTALGLARRIPRDRSPRADLCAHPGRYRV